MHWHILGGDAAATGSWFVHTFWNANGGFAPDDDIARNAAFTALTFAVGWIGSQGISRSKLKARVVDEMILTQSELRARAYPKVWRIDDPREAWMLDALVARLRFLHASINEAKSLKLKQIDAVEDYMLRVEEFIAKWAEVKRRGEAYHYAYNQAYRKLRAAAQALGNNENKRFIGLASPNDSLFREPPPPQPSNTRPPDRMGYGLAPAE